jgi:polyhydroxybutyrate depolymerase
MLLICLLSFSGIYCGSSGSGSSGAPGGGLGLGDTTTLNMQFGGLNRSFDVHVPITYDGSAPVPLVIDFHGFESTKEVQAFISGFIRKSDEEGFVVVYPQGFQNSWNAGNVCCGGAMNQNIDDVGFARAIVDKVSDLLNIDRTRVYATGLSNGGAMSHFLACKAADVFAAVAPVSFPLALNPLSDCQPSRPVAVIHFHGLNDMVVPYDGLGTIPSAPDSFEYWGGVDGCSTPPETTFTKGGSACDTFSNCDNDVKVTLCSISGGHVLYFNSDSVNIADLAWGFLSQFSISQ